MVDLLVDNREKGNFLNERVQVIGTFVYVNIISVCFCNFIDYLIV